MTKQTHTPGPWFVRANVEWLGEKICIGTNADENGEPVDTPTKNGGVYVAHAIGPEREANARLIAAAPDLLKALLGVLRVADRKTDEFDAARAAIAKATEGVGG